ncbi:MAG: cation-translocating P-type ATPase, partial [Tumebacillaceae bacterium]
MQIDSPYLVTVSASDRGRLVETVDFCREVQEGLAKDLKLVTLWNKAGIGLAMISPFSAPLINLMGDFLGVFLMSRHEWQKKRQTVNAAQPQQTNRLLETNQANQTPYHAMEQTELLHMLGTRFGGLTSDEVSVLRHQYGFNELEAPAPPDPMRIFLGQFKEFSTLILLGATGLSLFMGEWFNALCMGGILIVNAMIGTYQEVRSAGVLQALKDKDESQAKVVRGNIEQLLPTRDLVPGDIVLLEAGDMVPADLRILESWNLEVNEAILTGESLPAAKKADTMLQDTLMADRHNLMYMGTLVTRGRARALVVATGGATQIGALQSLLHQEEDAPTPLQQRVDQIGKRFVTGALIAGAVVGIAGLMRGIPPVQLLVSSITLAASAIPEGLPLTITIALTAGVMRMAKRKAVVRKLASLESLGRVTVICSDKTGTLTRNEMTVKEIVTCSSKFNVSGEGYNPKGTFHPYGNSGVAEVAATTELPSDVQQLLTIGLLCNNSSLEQNGANYESMGDPTETALLTVAMKAGISKGDWTRHREIPFDSNTGSMSVVCQESASHPKCLLLTKGSPEAILKKCTHYLDNGEVKLLTEAIQEQIVAENLRMAEQALRVLGFGYRELCADEEVHAAKEEGLIYVGLMGMIDPPKA